MAVKKRRISAARMWRLRGLAILFGLIPLVLAELTLRIFDLPAHVPAADPYVDLHDLRPLFSLDESTGLFRISDERLNLFRPASFARKKAEGSFRVFALGGSTTQGEPYSTETAFPHWLQLNLQAAVPNRQFEVINCGGLSYASYRVLAILREVLNYEANLVVIYTGHNEYLERRSYAGFHKPTWWNRATEWLSNFRLVQATKLIAGQSAERDEPAELSEMAAEVEALLDYQGGLEEYHRQDSWRQGVPEHFAWNLREMVRDCRGAGVPVILMRPVSNLGDCPPIKFETNPQLSADAKAQFEAMWNEARRTINTVVEAEPEQQPAPQRDKQPNQPTVLDRENEERRGRRQGEQSRAMSLLRGAVELDPEHAGVNYLLGRASYDFGNFREATRYLTLARDFDVCPLRAPSTILQTISDVAAAEGAPLVDAEALFSASAEHGIVGNDQLVDHIHPNLEGHQLLGEALALKCFELGLLPKPVDDWQETRNSLIKQHLASLSEAYFHRGKQRLAGLILWTQGRAKKVDEASAN